VVVESQAEFDAWAAEQTEIPEDNVSTGVGGGNGAGVYTDQLSE